VTTAEDTFEINCSGDQVSGNLVICSWTSKMAPIVDLKVEING